MRNEIENLLDDCRTRLAFFDDAELKKHSKDSRIVIAAKVQVYKKIISELEKILNSHE